MGQIMGALIFIGVILWIGGDLLKGKTPKNPFKWRK